MSLDFDAHTRYRPVMLRGSMDDLSVWLAWFTIELARRKHRKNESFCFSPPTGGTPARLYELLGTSMKGELDFRSEDTFVALDNYHLPPLHPNGYDTEIVGVLKSWGLSGDQLIKLPYREELDAQRAALEDFDRALENINIDLQGLGIGDDGHVAFQLRPESPMNMNRMLDSDTSLVELDQTVRLANARYFGGVLEDVPTHALTRGFSSILQADWIWILANSIVKANPMYTAFSGSPGVHCPASLLQYHPRVIVLIADDAAGPFARDPRVRRKLPSIEELLECASCQEYLDRC